MIVIVIIGVVYTLAIVQIKGAEEQKFAPSFKNLKEYLLSFIHDDAKSARLLCLDECEECSVYVDGEKVHSFESFFDESVQVYRYDFFEGMRVVQKGIFFNEENVQQDLCFSFRVDKKGVAEQLFVLHNEKVYDYTPYFTKTQVYDSLEAVVQVKEELFQKVMK
jgi:hypothetical protein